LWSQRQSDSSIKSSKFSELDQALRADLRQVTVRVICDASEAREISEALSPPAKRNTAAHKSADGGGQIVFDAAEVDCVRNLGSTMPSLSIPDLGHFARALRTVGSCVRLKKPDK